jgi:excisionase family DNA binding protein
MKQRGTQLGVRKIPDSPRVHGLRLAVNSSRQSARKPENGQDKVRVFPSSVRSAGVSDLPLTDTPDESTLGREELQGQLLTVHQVAALLHVPVSWVYGRTRKRSRERLPGYRLGKYWRFRETDILVWLKSQNELQGLV